MDGVTSHKDCYILIPAIEVDAINPHVGSAGARLTYYLTRDQRCHNKGRYLVSSNPEPPELCLVLLQDVVFAPPSMFTLGFCFARTHVHHRTYRISAGPLTYGEQICR